MNKEIAGKWVAALRSGAYRQGKGSLAELGCFCCLGVLCDLYAKEVGGWWDDDTEAFVVHEDMDGEMSVLPDAVVEWAGMHSHAGSYRAPVGAGGPLGLNSLSDHNDKGMTFGEIADIIDTKWEEL